MRRTAVVIDEQPLRLSGLEGVLARTDVDVLGKATTLEEGIAVIEAVRPDLVVASIDASDDKSAGTKFLRRLREVTPASRAVVFSSSSDAEDIDDALRAGAVAYVFKTARAEDFAVAVRQAFQQSIFFELPAVGARSDGMPAHPAHANGREGPMAPRAVDGARLTKRELEILRLVADGKTNAEVAGTLWVTEETVKFHLSNTYRKLGAANRTEASRWAYVNGVVGRSHGDPATV